MQGKVEVALKEEPVSASSSDIETEPEGKRNGTAAPQNELPDAKVAKADETAKVSGEKVGENGEAVPTAGERAVGSAVLEIAKESTDVVADKAEMQRALNEGDPVLAQRLSALEQAAQTIKSWIENKTSNASFVLELPKATIDFIRKRTGLNIDNHVIASNGIRHGLKNHGESGKKLTENSIPVRNEDAELIPYIMTAPDTVEKGSVDINGRESVRFTKTLSNGVVVVVEKENKINPNDMETINIWAEMPSSNVANAYAKHYPGATSKTVTISTEDAAKIRKDAETAIAKDNYLQKMAHFSKEVYERKAEYAARRNQEDKEKVASLSEEQHDLLSELASLRHKLHSNIDRMVKGGENDFYQRLERLKESLYNAGFKNAWNLPDLSDCRDILTEEEVDPYFPKYENFESDIEYEKARQEWYDASYYDFYKDYEKANKKIEDFLLTVDKEHGTHYAPTGYARMQFLKTKGGEVYGFVKDGKMYVDPDLINPETPLHEYGHLWDEALRANNGELWARWKELVRGSELWQDVVNDENYADIRDNEDLVASEVKSRLTGKGGAERLQALVDEAQAKGGVIGAAEKVDFVARVKNMLKTMWEATKRWFADSNVFMDKFTKEQIRSMSVEDFVNKTLNDFAEGVDVAQYRNGVVDGDRAQYRFVGEKGAENADRAEGTTFRMDNLKVAEEMEKEYKDLQGSEEHNRIVEASKRVKELKPIKVEAHDMSREEQKAKYVGFGDATNKETGVNVKFFSNAFDKNHREGGLFEKAVPQLKDGFENAVFAYSEPEKLAGTTRRDGTVHKEHRSVRSYDNYVNKLNIDGKDYYVRYTVQMQPGQNGIHSQFISNVELYDAENPTKVASYRASSGPARLDFNEISDAKLRNFFNLASETEEEFAKKMKLATGWERGADGKWRYEESDFDVDIRGRARQYEISSKFPYLKEFESLMDKGKLSEDELSRLDELTKMYEDYMSSYMESEKEYLDDYVIDKKLFKEYPELRQTKLVFVNYPNLKTAGAYSEKDNCIYVNTAVSEDARTTLAHEIQHAIQRIEGFATGGNSRNDADYRRLAGEVEARNVQERLNYSDEQRRQSLASATEDVPRDEQSVRFGGGIMADDGAAGVPVRGANETLDVWRSGMGLREKISAAMNVLGERTQKERVGAAKASANLGELHNQKRLYLPKSWKISSIWANKAVFNTNRSSDFNHWNKLHRSEFFKIV